MYEPISMEIDRACDDGTYRSHNIIFIGRLVHLIENGLTTMRLYEWVDRGYVICLVHVAEEKPGRLPRRTLLRQGHTEEGIHRRGGFSGVPGVRPRGR